MYTNRCGSLNPPRIDIEAASAADQDENRQLLAASSARSERLSPPAYSPDLENGSFTHAISRTNLGSTTPGGQSSMRRNRSACRPSVFARCANRRAVFKNGTCNVEPLKGSNRRLRFLQDLFTTLVDTRWRWTLSVFAIGFIGSWLFFALLYWFISYVHGDLEEEHLPHNQEANNWTPCIAGIYSLTSCFLFSLETQHTIGYGTRSTNEECPEAVFVMSMQSVHGVMIQALLAGIIFAKMTRPKRRSQTLLFSRYAAISLRDGDFCLMFRVGDLAKSHIIGAKIRAQLIRRKSSREGEMMPQYLTELDLEVDGCGPDMFFIWPQVVVHRITKSSPLWKMGPLEMTTERFEIVVVLEGTIESTGQSTQARSSYLNSEILWGYRFEPILSFNKEQQSYVANFAKFNEMIPVCAPNCSAKEHAEANQDLFSGRNNVTVDYATLMDRLERFHMENEQNQNQLRHVNTTGSCYLQPPPSATHLPGRTSQRSQSSRELRNTSNATDNNVASAATTGDIVVIYDDGTTC